jgi:hypothetical protein
VSVDGKFGEPNSVLFPNLGRGFNRKSTGFLAPKTQKQPPVILAQVTVSVTWWAVLDLNQ